MAIKTISSTRLVLALAGGLAVGTLFSIIAAREQVIAPDSKLAVRDSGNIGRIAAIRTDRDSKLQSVRILPVNLVMAPYASDKDGAIAKAFELYPKPEMIPDSSPGDWQAFLQNRKARVAYLEQRLTPEELLAYRMARDGNTHGITRLLHGINPSDDEFKNVFSALDGESLNRANGYLAPELESRLRQALGESRYADYRAANSEANLMFDTFVRTHNLTDEQVQQLNNLRASPDVQIAEYQSKVKAILPARWMRDQYFSTPLYYRSSGR